MKQHEPGKIHVWTFDQADVWVPEHGREVLITDMDINHVKNTVLFLLRNAERFRRVYDTHAYIELLAASHPNDELPDFPDFDYTRHEAQRWMLDRPLMKRLLLETISERVTKDRPGGQAGLAADPDRTWGDPC